MNNRELDAQVAERVMGWQSRTYPDGALPDVVHWSPLGEWKSQMLPHYSTSISDAWIVVEAMRKRTFNFEFHARKGRMVAFFTIMRGSENDVNARGEADTAPEAISRAALEAVK